MVVDRRLRRPADAHDRVVGLHAARAFVAFACNVRGYAPTWHGFPTHAGGNSSKAILSTGKALISDLLKAMLREQSLLTVAFSVVRWFGLPYRLHGLETNAVRYFGKYSGNGGPFGVFPFDRFYAVRKAELRRRMRQRRAGETQIAGPSSYLLIFFAACLA
jgi:hypothetical protein